MRRRIQTVMMESLVVGFTTLGLGFALMLYPSPNKFIQQVKLGQATAPLVGCFLIGFLFHIIAEYTNVNEWYVRTRENAW